ncbi:MAG: symmetrical bis(5'-nucleosyl)-tetraphosphatase [Gammaproteobacteria bacterium]|jgi:bis(5'-nucleosyl)-tetraphosphatase (symmetrical)|nr:symmetrical bis(5'-nucleosyl)-tetraphosphatase [Gammaproteobacteria bacterium]
MPTYVIGDVQGCLTPLEQLLTKIQFRPEKDHLWFTGDLINRGHQSLETLRFIKQLPKNTICVLGNHDLALLAVAQKAAPVHPKDTFQDIIDAPDKDGLLEWVRQRPLLHHDPKLRYTLTHAGIYPAWTLEKAISLAQEVEELLRGSQWQNFIQNMYGNFPLSWDDNLVGWDRARFIINAFTRMRFLMPDGSLNMTSKGNPADHPDEFPWYAFPYRQTQHEKIVFGHWAALGAQCDEPDIYPVDSGCVWGKCLTAFCIQTAQKVTVDCNDYIRRPFISGPNHGKVRAAQKSNE